MSLVAYNSNHSASIVPGGSRRKDLKLPLAALTFAAVGCANAAETPAARVPSTVAIVKSIDLSNPQNPSAVIEATGLKPITAAVIVNSDPPPDRGDFTTMNFPGSPLSKGQTLPVFAWDNSTLENTYIAAVIFADGTTLGSHLDTATGKQVIDELFEERKGSAEEWDHWMPLIESGRSDPHSGLRTWNFSVYVTQTPWGGYGGNAFVCAPTVGENTASVNVTVNFNCPCVSSTCSYGNVYKGCPACPCPTPNPSCPGVHNKVAYELQNLCAYLLWQDRNHNGITDPVN